MKINQEIASEQSTLLSEDASPFEQLRSEYNFLNIHSYGDIFTNVIVGELSRRGGGIALDIGCGKGIGRDVQFQYKVKAASTELWGVEPDTEIEPEPALFDNFQHALLETADLPDGSIDVAYSSMVMEHVEKPIEFFHCLRRILKPDGVYLFVTPNAQSIIPRLAGWAHSLRVDEWLLRMIRRKSVVEEYHYPVQYLCNKPSQLEKLARDCGFFEPQFAYIEGPGANSYLRGPLAVMRPVIEAKRRTFRNPRRLATMICRMQRRPE